MNLEQKLTLRNRILWGVIGVLSLCGLVLGVRAYGGSAQVVIENFTGSVFPEGFQSEDLVGSAVISDTTRNTNFNETCEIEPNNQKVRCEGFIYLSLPAVGAATTTDYFTNNLGQAIYINADEALIQLAGTVSSTFTAAMGTSAASGLTVYTAAQPSNILSTLVVTSTVGASDAGIIRTTSTKHSIYLADDSHVVISVKADGSNGCTGAFCESVTSSARGWTGFAVIPYSYVKNY